MTATETRPPRQGRIDGWDGLRAISALLVFFEHKVIDLGTGGIGVWVFFAISGYLIVGILHGARGRYEAGETTRGQALLHFWRNRALRILPIYYLVVVTLFLLTHALDHGGFAYYLFYLQNFHIAWVTRSWGPTTHLWSLAVEQQFYLFAAPLLIYAAAAWHKRIVGALLGLCVLFSVSARAFGWDPLSVSLLPPLNFSFMAIGGLAYLAPPASVLARVLRHGSVLALSAAAMVIAFALTRPGYDSANGEALSVYLTGLLFAGALVAWTPEHQNSWLVRALEAKPLRWLGTISYGFYVYHALLPGPERLIARVPRLTAVPQVVWIAVELGTSILLADLSWRFFERRFLALKRSPRAGRA